MPTYRRTFATVTEIVNEAALEMGVADDAVADPFDESGAIYKQLLQNLKSLGQDMVREFAWSQLLKEGRFTTDGEFGENDLPTDFDRFVDGTLNDRNSGWPAAPIGPQGWQAIKARTALGPINLQVRLQGAIFKSLPVTALADVYYEYVSAYWIQTSDALTEPDTDAPGDGSHRVWFDRRLMVAGLKCRWLEDRERAAAAAALRVFEDALSRAKCANGPSPVLNAAGPAGMRFLDGNNITDGDIGT